MVLIDNTQTINFTKSTEVRNEEYLVKLCNNGSYYTLEAYIYNERYGKDNPYFVFQHHLKTLGWVNHYARCFGFEFVETK